MIREGGLEFFGSISWDRVVKLYCTVGLEIGGMVLSSLDILIS